MDPKEKAKELGAKVRDRLLRKAQVVRRVLATDDGRELLEILDVEFATKLQGKDEHETLINAGRADVVAWLRAMNRLKEE